VTFSIPFTFGQSFRLGLYARALAGVRPSTATGGASYSQVHGLVRWLGISNVIDRAGLPVTGFAVASAGGLSWTGIPPTQQLPITSRMTKAGTLLQLEWYSIENQEFVVEQSTDLRTWTPLPGLVRATGGTTVWPVVPPAGDHQRFYRVWLNF
jgi:hypothetical protein